MKTKKTILSLAISALLTAGVASYPMSSYAEDDKSKSSEDDKSKSSEDDKSKSSEDDKSKSSDSDARGSSDKSSQKITICHVPPGNPAQKHTLHIAFSAWAAHKAHTNTKGPDFADYLGSCNNPPITPASTPTSTTTTEKLHVISGCTGATREALETKVQSYFEPITVADTALDDESVVTAMSQCLDKGDSSDSGKGGDSSKSASGGKGRGRDSVSDSGQHHRIRGCLNKDTVHKADSSDSSKHGSSDSDKDVNNTNYHKKLKDADSGNDTAKGIKDPVVVSDSSLDDKDVWKEYKKCVVDASDSNKLDPSKTGKAKSADSGHKQHIVKSCGADQDQKLKDVIAAYKAKPSTKDLILTETSYNDVSIKQAVDACVTAGAKDTITTPTTSPSSSTGFSGRQNFREDTSPIKDATSTDTSTSSTNTGTSTSSTPLTK
jgi:hypothetical protein